MAELPKNDSATDKPTNQPAAQNPAPPPASEPVAPPTETAASQPAETVDPSTNPDSAATDEAPAEALPADTPEAAPEEPTIEAAPSENTVPPPAAPPTAAGKKKPKLIFIIGGVIVLIIFVIIALMLSAGKSNKANVTNTTTSSDDEKEKTDSQKENALKDPEAYANLFIYGTWDGKTSLIKAVDLTTQKTKLLATLPASSKKVTILSPETIAFVDQTDQQDYGRQVMIYNIKKNSPQSSIGSSGSGFGVKDYVVSPDKKYIAIWEVSSAPNTQQLLGGRSRVFAVDLRRPTVKSLLYDEKIGPDPVHYPLAILNSGRVFADKFLPGDTADAAGWGYGISIIDADATNKQELPQLSAGTYGTQPTLSPDGKYLLFSGYDGNRGDGMTLNNGTRQSLLTPDTIEIFDVPTLTRKRFAKFESTNIYPTSMWDPSTGKILLTMTSDNPDNAGFYTYDMKTQELTKINLPATANTKFSFITELTFNTSIIGIQDTSVSKLGNLGNAYSYPFSQVAMFDTDSSEVSYLKFEDRFLQYITVLPNSYFK